MKASDLPAAVLAGMPRDEAGPVFAEPWQANLFALTVKLAEACVFTWPEWAEAFGATLSAARVNQGPLGPETYFDLWLVNLEGLLEAKGIAQADERDHLKAAWRAAYLATPHGQPVKPPQIGQD